jgi:hypothetical protein
MSEEQIKKFYMRHIHISHLLAPIEQKVDEDKRQAVFTYLLDKGSCQRIYATWVYTVYLS